MICLKSKTLNSNPPHNNKLFMDKKNSSKNFNFLWSKIMFEKNLNIFCFFFKIKKSNKKSWTFSTTKKHNFFLKKKTFGKSIPIFSKIIFNHKELFFSTRLFLKIISWSRRIVLEQFQNDSGRFECRRVQFLLVAWHCYRTVTTGVKGLR